MALILRWFLLSYTVISIHLIFITCDNLRKEIWVSLLSGHCRLNAMMFITQQLWQELCNKRFRCSILLTKFFDMYCTIIPWYYRCRWWSTIFYNHFPNRNTILCVIPLDVHIINNRCSTTFKTLKSSIFCVWHYYWIFVLKLYAFYGSVSQTPAKS